jgi:hypothetical protein
MNEMHDPNELYPSILKNTCLEKSWRSLLVNVPDVRDQHDELIMPHEYGSKLKDGTIVMINAYLKLFFFLVFGGEIIVNHHFFDCRYVDDDCNRDY